MPYSGWRVDSTSLDAQNGFGSSGGGFASKQQKKKNKKKSKKSNRLINTLDDKPRPEASKNKPFVKSEQDDLLETLSAKAADTCIGRAVTQSPVDPSEMDPFWGLMPSLINSRFPNVPDQQFERVAGMVRHALDPSLPLEDSIINDKWRPHDEIHAYMPGLGPTKAFHDPSQLDLCLRLTQNYRYHQRRIRGLNSRRERSFPVRY